MHINAKDLDAVKSHHLLRNLVMPRPIALISTINRGGLVNVAPFSFYGVVSVLPPLLGIAIGRRQGKPKDTIVNIRQTGEMVINLVTEAMAEKTNIAAIDFPPAESEVGPAGFSTRPAAQVRPPLIADSPAQMECTLKEILVFGGDEGAHDFVIAEVVAFHVQDKLWKNGAPDCLGMNVLGRLGDDYYAGVREPREMKRLRYAEFMSGRSPHRS